MGATKVAKKTQAKRMATLAACTVAIADLYSDLLKAERRLTPEIESVLNAIQEIAYGTVDKNDMDEFGNTILAITGAANGASPTETEGQTATTQPSSVGGNGQADGKTL